MSTTLFPAQLQSMIDALIQARADGVRRVRDASGHETEYRSDAELAAAIKSLEALLANPSGSAPVHTIRFRTSKGV